MPDKVCKACGGPGPFPDFWHPRLKVKRPRAVCAGCYRRQANASRNRREGRSLPPIVILSDLHIPEHDRRFWAALLAWLKDNRPAEIILNGDFGEFAAVSQHAGPLAQRLADDFADVGRAIDDLRAVAPNAKITYMEGNHETRLQRTIESLAPALDGVLTVPDGLKLKDRGVTWVGEREQPIRRGRLAVIHGHQFGGKYGTKHHAAKAADLYATAPGTVSVHGHTHNPQVFTRPVAGGTVTAIGSGCGRTIQPDEVKWLHGREAGWVQQFVVAWVMETFVSVYPVTVTSGQFVWNGRLYGGKP